MNLSLMVRESASRLPDKPAVIVGERVCTYGRLEAAIARTAAALRGAGVRPGHKVALTAPNGPEFVAVLMGILRAGAIAVPAASDIRTPERDTMIELVRCEYQLAMRAAGTGRAVTFKALDDAAARDLYLEPTAHLDAGPPDARLLAMDASNIRFTSGTTASFKGVVLSHHGIAERIEVANRALKISDRDTVFFGLPMAHHFAVSIMLHLSVGATIVTGGAFLADALVEQVRRHRATIIYTTPVTYRLMAEAPNADASALANVRLAISTAMALPTSVAEAFGGRFGLPLSQALGIIEVGMPIMNLPGEDYKPGAIGRLIDGFESRVLDEEGRDSAPDAVGQLLLRGPGMLAGYYAPWREPEEVLADGWFASGDLVRRDADGCFFIVGRTKDVINVGGTKVFPYEIEDVLTAHEAVLEAVVIAAPDDVLGEVPTATVVLRPGGAADSQELMDHCRRCLSPVKLPRHVQIVAKLPRTHSGKVARARINA